MRNAAFRAATRGCLPALIAVFLLSACVTPRPEIFPPPPRTSPAHAPAVVTETVSPLRHRSVSTVSGDIRFLDGPLDGVDLGRVVVYLVPHFPDAQLDDEGRQVVITSRTPEFAPGLTAVGRGDRVVLANEGPLSHGLFSAELGGARIDLPPGTRSAPLTLPPRGPVRFYCALHAEETFVVYVGRVRHVAVVEPGEMYMFDPVDAGRYTLSIWSRNVEGPVRDLVVDGYSSTVEPVWIDPRLVRRPADPDDGP